MLTNYNTSVKIEGRILIISLIFVALLYSVFLIKYGVHLSTSFLFGAVASLFDVYALARLVRTVITTGAGWLFVPLGVFRWLLVGFIIFVAFYFYKAEPLPLAVGVAIPFICVIVSNIYKLFWGNKNGTSS